MRIFLFLLSMLVVSYHTFSYAEEETPGVTCEELDKGVALCDDGNRKFIIVEVILV